MQVQIKNITLNMLLKRILKSVSPSTNNSLNILLRIIDKKIYCVAINDLIEIATYETLDTIQNNLEIIINYDLIYNISRKSKLDSYITLKKEKKHLEIITHDSIYKIPRKINILPSFELDGNKLLKINLKAKKFIYLLKHIKLSIPEGTIENFLNKFILEINNNTITGISSDGLRLSFFNTAINSFSSKKFKVILNKDIIKNIINIFEDDIYITMIIYNSKIKIVSENLIMTFNVMNEFYNIPNIRVDKTRLNIFKINRALMLNILDKVSILKIEHNRILFKLTKNKTFITGGNFTESVTCFINHDYPIENDIIISFNYKHLKEILKLTNEKFFDFIIANDNKIIIIREINSEFLHIIMPFNI
ncbi:MAG: hypothetical protein KDH96_06455 [Candidatus Riesia sp.]|nr:hypothetical protein [Candidatus Riesia sp.]